MRDSCASGVGRHGAGGELFCGGDRQRVRVGLAPKTYSSCAKLHKDFKHGVAKSKKAAKKQVADGLSMPAYSDRAQKVYWSNT